MKHLIIVISAACSVMCAHGQTLLDLRTQTRDVDFSVSPFTRPVKVGAGLPVTCGLGDLYFRSDVTPGGNLYGCTASDTWTQMSSSPATLPGSSTYSAGLGLLLAGTAFGADFSVLPGLALSNTWSNMNDFSLGQLRVQVGAGVPSSLTCASSSNVGKIYVRSDAQATNASHYSCNQTGAGVYSWELTQSSGGGGGGTLATASTPVFSPAAGSYSSAQNVSITCPYGSPYYTVGGTSVAAYGSAINVSSSETIRAGCYGFGYAPTLASAAYTIQASTPTLVAHTGGHGDSTFSLSSLTTTGADFLFATVGYYTGGLPAISDAVTGCASPCNTWVPLTLQTGSGVGIRGYYAANATTGANHVITVTGTGFYGCAAVAAFSGVAASSPLDVTTGSGNVTGATYQIGTLTTTVNGELVLAGIGFGGGATTSLTVDSPYTITDTIPVSGDQACSLAYQVQSTAAATNPTWYANPGFFGGLGGTIAAFK